MEDSILSLQGVERLTREASTAVSADDYELAVRKLQEARELSNQLSNFYQQLSANFSGIDNRLYQQHRRMALEAAQLRDRATYQLALVHRERENLELAVPLLVQIVASQNPTREMGNQAYRQLYELGFVESDFEVEAPQAETEEGEDAEVMEAEAETEDAPRLARNSILSMGGVEGLIEEANAAVANENYTQAASKLQEAREIANQLSNFYQQLAGSFSGIDNGIFEEQRRFALEAAQLRDEATYQLALVHRAQDRPELAVPLLVQIVGSQNPTRDLGNNAYRQLFELGFVNDPYTAGRRN
jgi:hypothetical protein